MSSMICTVMQYSQSFNKNLAASYGFLRSSRVSILVRPHQMIALKKRHICLTIRFATGQVENIFVLRKFKWKYIICDIISILKKH
jgi:hypothetical protein